MKYCTAFVEGSKKLKWLTVMKMNLFSLSLKAFQNVKRFIVFYDIGRQCDITSQQKLHIQILDLNLQSTIFILIVYKNA